MSLLSLASFCQIRAVYYDGLRYEFCATCIGCKKKVAHQHTRALLSRILEVFVDSVIVHCLKHVRSLKERTKERKKERKNKRNEGKTEKERQKMKKEKTKRERKLINCQTCFQEKKNKIKLPNKQAMKKCIVSLNHILIHTVIKFIQTCYNVHAIYILVHFELITDERWWCHN